MSTVSRFDAGASETALHLAGAAVVREVREDGELVGYDVEPPVDTLDYAAALAAALGALKSALKAAIDRAAEDERARYITLGAGQAMTYARKVEEARMADADTDPDPADYPLLAASVGIDAPDIAGVAGLVLAMDAQWTAVGAAIETTRLAAKKAIGEAVNEAAAQMAFDAVAWPAPA